MALSRNHRAAAEEAVRAVENLPLPPGVRGPQPADPRLIIALLSITHAVLSLRDAVEQARR